jgi:hypothetical protein
MASIDKTYVNFEEWCEAKKFHDETLEAQIKAMGRPISLYYETEKEAAELGDDFILWNTSQLQDAWLFQNCKLDFVQRRLACQYNSFKNGSDIFAGMPEIFILMNFEEPGAYLVRIESEKINMDFFYNKDDEMLIYDQDDTILIYGTTLALKVIDEVKEFVHFNGGYKQLNYDVAILYYGINLIYKADKKEWFLSEPDKELSKEMSPLAFTNLRLPKINYSFKSSDIFKVIPEAVYFSSETEVYHLTDFKEYEKYVRKADKKVFLNRFGIPDYITNFIK